VSSELRQLMFAFSAACPGTFQKSSCDFPRLQNLKQSIIFEPASPHLFIGVRAVRQRASVFGPGLLFLPVTSPSSPLRFVLSEKWKLRALFLFVSGTERGAMRNVGLKHLFFFFLTVSAVTTCNAFLSRSIKVGQIRKTAPLYSDLNDFPSSFFRSDEEEEQEGTNNRKVATSTGLINMDHFQVLANFYKDFASFYQHAAQKIPEIVGNATAQAHRVTNDACVQVVERGSELVMDVTAKTMRASRVGLNVTRDACGKVSEKLLPGVAGNVSAVAAAAYERASEKFPQVAGNVSALSAGAYEYGRNVSSAVYEQGRSFSGKACEQGSSLAYKIYRYGVHHSSPVYEKGRHWASIASKVSRKVTDVLFEHGSSVYDRVISSQLYAQGRDIATVACEHASNVTTAALEGGRNITDAAHAAGRNIACLAYRHGSKWTSNAVQQGRNVTKLVYERGRNMSSHAYESAAKKAPVLKETVKELTANICEKVVDVCEKVVERIPETLEAIEEKAVVAYEQASFVVKDGLALAIESTSSALASSDERRRFLIERTERAVVSVTVSIKNVDSGEIVVAAGVLVSVILLMVAIYRKVTSPAVKHLTVVTEDSSATSSVSSAEDTPIGRDIDITNSEKVAVEVIRELSTLFMG
jgi:hypothetical protein